MEVFTSVVGGLRSAREELGLARDMVGRVHVFELEPGAAAGIAKQAQEFRQLSSCELVGVASAGKVAPEGRFASVEGPGVMALLDLGGLVDVSREQQRLLAKAKKAAAEAVKAQAKLGNSGFVAKAPGSVIDEERERLTRALAVLEETRRQYKERIGEELPLEGGPSL